jgi:hypothetical protein
MKKEVKKGDSPINSRIKIDYQGKKPKISFSYPDKKNQVNSSMFAYILFCWMVIILFVSLGNSLFGGDGIYLSSKDLSRYDYTNCVLQEARNSSATSSSILFDTCKEFVIFEFSSNHMFSDLVVFLVLLFVPPALIYFPLKKKFWNNISPKFNAFIRRKKYKTFYPKDVRQDLDGNYFVEILVFNNIVLNYNATKGFSKYLKSVEIREHDFKYNKRKRKGKKRQFKVNEWYWYARFKFSQKPTKGKLEVVFK